MSVQFLNSSRYTCGLLVVAALLFVSVRSVQGQNASWTAEMGGSYNEDSYSCVEGPNRAYVIVGSTFSYGSGNYDVYVMHLDSLGATIWSKPLGGAASDYGRDIQATSDGGYIIIGTTYSFGAGGADLFLCKIDATGALIWKRTYGGLADDEGWSIRPTNDQSFILAGTTRSFGAGYGDVWLLKISEMGDTLWSKTFGGVGGESGSSACLTPDGGYVVVGATGTFGEGYGSIYTIKTNSAGDSLWTSTYGGIKADFGYDVAIAPDGGYLIAGASASPTTGYSDGYLVKTDASGAVLWQKTYGGGRDERIYSVAVCPDGGFVMCGTTDSYGAGGIDMYLIKTDPTGVMLWNHTYGGAQSDFCRKVMVDGRGDYVLAGYSYSFSVGGSDAFVSLVAGDQMTDVQVGDETILPSIVSLAQNYPNPFNLTTKIPFTLLRRGEVRLEFYNILGQIVQEWQLGSLGVGEHAVEWDGSNSAGLVVSSGVYFYRLYVDKHALGRKMTLVK